MHRFYFGCRADRESYRVTRINLSTAIRVFIFIDIASAINACYLTFVAVNTVFNCSHAVFLREVRVYFTADRPSYKVQKANGEYMHYNRPWK